MQGFVEVKALSASRSAFNNDQSSDIPA